MKPALSTMWMQYRADHVLPWWEQVRQLGFAHIELSHIVTPAMLTGIRAGDLSVSSLHYPCPTTPHPHDARPADTLIASTDESLRRWAVEHGRRSIDLAAELGATAVCIHPGRIEMPERLEWVVRQRYLGGYFGSPAYERALSDLLAARAAAAEPNLSAVRRSLQELAHHAQAAGIRLGIETRLFIQEMPTLEEALLLVSDHDPDVLGLWYDSGHVQVQANLGMPSQSAWLEALGHRIVAAHLHDTIGLRDHLLPSSGEIDFAHIAERLPASALRVCEFDWYFTPTEVVEAAGYLSQTGCCAPLEHSHTPALS